MQRIDDSRIGAVTTGTDENSIRSLVNSIQSTHFVPQLNQTTTAREVIVLWHAVGDHAIETVTVNLADGQCSVQTNRTNSNINLSSIPIAKVMFGGSAKSTQPVYSGSSVISNVLEYPSDDSNAVEIKNAVLWKLTDVQSNQNTSWSNAGAILAGLAHFTGITFDTAGYNLTNRNPREGSST